MDHAHTCYENNAEGKLGQDYDISEFLPTCISKSQEDKHFESGMEAWFFDINHNYYLLTRFNKLNGLPDRLCSPSC